jgi:hypothetical protein
VEVVAAMNHRSGISFVLPCEPHRRSLAKQAEMRAMRRELARLDRIDDHVLDVVVDRLLEVLDLPEPQPATRVIEPKTLTLVHVAPECVERTVERAGPSALRV